jgi:hypothetical protein
MGFAALNALLQGYGQSLNLNLGFNLLKKVALRVVGVVAGVVVIAAT